MEGSRMTSLFAILRSKDNNNEGSSNKLDNIANNNVAETNAPKATVPPKLEVVNRTYLRLFPVMQHIPIFVFSSG
jgi:hypothetical protein